MRGSVVVVGFVAGLAAAIVLVALTLAALVPTCVSCVAKQRARFVVDAPGPSLDLVDTQARRDEVLVPTTTAHGPRALRGTLAVPTISGRRPAAILLAGSGPANRDGDTPADIVRTYDAPFPVLAHLDNLLATKGIITLRWDKRACAACYPEVPWDSEAFTFDDLVQDARAALAFLRAREEVDPTKLIIVGHSEGGGLALELLDEPGVIGVVSLAGLLEGFDTGLIGQFHRAASVRAQQADLFGAVGFLAVGWRYARCFANDEESCAGGGVSHRAQRAYIESSKRAPDRLRAARVPVLALLGSADRNADPDVFERLARSRVNKRIRWQHVANADHALADIATAELHVDTVAAIETWLRADRARD